MRKALPIKLFCPASIVKVITDNTKTRVENYVFIIHYILLRPVKDKRLSEFIPLNRKTLSTLFNCNIAPYINFLCNYELIIRDNNFIPTQKSYHYRINPKHRFDLKTFELKPETPLFKNLILDIRRERANNNLLTPFLSEMRTELMNLQYNYQDALEWILNVPDERKKLSYAIAINQLHDARFRYFKRNSTNKRLDTNLTNLKRELRQFIEVDYVSIDLKNSNPFFLSILLQRLNETIQYYTLKREPITQETITALQDNKHLLYCVKLVVKDLVKSFGIQTIKDISKTHSKSDFAFFMSYSKFKRWVADGVLYDEMQKQYNDMSRDECKKMMFEILFSRNVVYYGHKAYIPYQGEKEIFKSIFPGLFEVIEVLKGSKDHARLAIYLQNMESRIFIDEIAKQLVEVGIVPLTIHDSIIVRSHQQEDAMKIIHRVFKKEFGVIPSFKIEPIHQSFDTESGGLELINGTNSKTIEIVKTTALH